MPSISAITIYVFGASAINHGIGNLIQPRQALVQKRLPESALPALNSFSTAIIGIGIYYLLAAYQENRAFFMMTLARVISATLFWKQGPAWRTIATWDAIAALLPAYTAAIDASSLKGKYLYGYQGWFRNPSSGLNTHWSADGGQPGPDNVVIDFIPDVSEYPPECLFDTAFTLPDGTNARFYDNTCEGVVDLHFKWMQQYGVDGIIVQRFYGSMGDRTFLTVLDQVQAAAEKYERVFLVEYDVSGADSSQGSVADAVVSDYNDNIKKYTSSPAYIHQDGKPVVMAFGFGFPDRAVSIGDGVSFVSQMKSAPAYVGLGVPAQWSEDVRQQKGFAEVYKAADLISPWTIGAYSLDGYPGYNADLQQPDMELASSLDIAYGPVIWPGTSAYHLDGGRNPGAFDYFPRHNGSFYEMQAETLISQDPFFLFTAMFDEVNEGTGSYACLETSELPTNEPFVGVDNDMESNYYLKLGGQLAAKLHNAEG